MEEKIIDELMKLIYGYRGIYILWHLLCLYKKEFELKELSATEIEYRNFLETELQNYFHNQCGTSIHTLEIKEIILNNVPNLIQYNIKDLKSTWDNIDAIGFDFNQCLENSHKFKIEGMFYNYIKSMTELNRSLTFNFNAIEKYFKDKNILDWGCGSQFYSNLFKSKFKIKSYVEVDRQDVIMALNTDEICADTMFVTLYSKDTENSSYENYFDTIWLSEVLHSQKNPKEFIQILLLFLKKGGHLLINELKSFTSRSFFFNIQMLFHCRLFSNRIRYTLQPPIRKELGIEFVKEIDFTKYHHILIFKKE